jgi:PTS system nitrogen regulatory IIA component
MQLTVEDVARLFGVSEGQIHHWIEDAGLPVAIVNSRYRFNRTELLEWATVRQLDVSPDIFQDQNGDSVEKRALSDALRRGGVVHVSGDAHGDFAAVLRMALHGLPLPEGFDVEDLVQLLVARQSAGSTALGDGIAIPHARFPVVLKTPSALVRLCFLNEPIRCHTPDSQPVDTMFVMVCPTVHAHLQLLAKLAGALRDADFRRFLRRKPNEAEILRDVGRIEESLTEPLAS